MSTVFIIYNTVVRKIDHVMLWLSTRSTKCYIVGYMQACHDERSTTTVDTPVPCSTVSRACTDTDH